MDGKAARLSVAGKDRHCHCVGCFMHGLCIATTMPLLCSFSFRRFIGDCVNLLSLLVYVYDPIEILPPTPLGNILVLRTSGAVSGSARR